MKHILFVLAAACSIMMLGSGCATIITGEPIAEKNEFKDASLPGVWIDRDKDIPSYVEDRGDHYIIYNPVINGVPFVLTKIKSADNSKELKFFCANITPMLKNDPDFPGGDVYFSNAYECSGNKIMIYDLSEKSDLVKKLQTYYDKKQDKCIIQSAELKRLLSENMDAWQKSKTFYWKAEFKNSRAGELCVAGIKFFSDYNDIMFISKLWEKGKINAEQAKQRKAELDAKMQAWRKKYAAANPELDKIIAKYLPQLDAAFAAAKHDSIGKLCKELNEEYWKKAVQELIK